MLNLNSLIFMAKISGLSDEEIQSLVLKSEAVSILRDVFTEKSEELRRRYVKDGSS